MISVNFRASPRVRTLILVGVLTAATFVIDLSYSTRESINQDRVQLMERALVLAKIFGETVAEPVSRLDRARAMAQLESFQSINNLASASISLPNGELFTEAGAPRAEGGVISIATPVFRSGAQIATLKLSFSTRHLETVLLENLSSGAIRYTVLLIIIVGGVFLAFQIILRPIERMTTFIYRLAAGDIDFPVPNVGRSDEIGEMAAAISAFKDNIVERAKAEASLAERARELSRAKEVLSDAIDNISDGFALWDVDDTLLMRNDRYRAIFHRLDDILKPGLSYQEFARETLTRGVIPIPENSDFREAYEGLLKRHATQQFELEQQMGTGEWVRVSKTRTNSGRNVGLITDITERKMAEATIQQMALHDALTGLPNRTFFQKSLREAITHADRTRRLVGVILLDLDHFKTVNDTLGHPHGDELLKAVAERLGTCIRKSDSVARLGGDEFSVIANNNEGVPGITMLARRMVKAMAAPFVIDGQEVFSGISLGISVYPLDGADPDQLIRNADMALYKAKDEGRGMFRLYDERMNLDIRHRRRVEDELRLALERNEFHLHYQPQIDVTSGRIVGAEALIRWRHPERGNVPPGEFISIAESSRLIIPISQWVLHEACKQNRSWQAMGLPEICIGVNASPLQFSQNTIVAQVNEALSKSRLPAECLELEITEGITMAGGEETNKTLELLRAVGVRLSIDDFGTGYSSLNYLKKFPVDRLKIDRSFVQDITHDWGNAAISSAVIQLGHVMNIRVIAEGVETLEQASFLVRQGCDELQGYYYGRPMAADDFTALLRDHDPERVLRDLANTEPVGAIPAIG